MSDFKSVKDLIDQIIQINVKSEIDLLIVALSDKFSINREDIYQCLRDFEQSINKNYLSESNVTIEINEDKCLGKTKYNTQCSRSRQIDSEFCGSHLIKLPYGRIDKPSNESSENIICKKRGRPKKETDI